MGKEHWETTGERPGAFLPGGGEREMGHLEMPTRDALTQCAECTVGDVPYHGPKAQKKWSR